jgi:hypothetical protein
MSDRAPSRFECAEAQLAVEAVWSVARQRSTATDDLLALEMMIQGLAVLKKVDAEVLREDLAAGRLGLGAFLADLKPKGSG